MLAWAGLFGLSVLVVGLVLLFLWHPRMGELFHRHVRDRPKRRLFLAAVGFFLTLALARGAAYAAARGIAPYHYLHPRGAEHDPHGVRNELRLGRRVRSLTGMRSRLHNLSECHELNPEARSH